MNKPRKYNTKGTREIKFRAWDKKQKKIYLLDKLGWLQQADDLTKEKG